MNVHAGSQTQRPTLWHILLSIPHTSRCFGLLISPVQVVKGSEMNLLDNMSCTYPNSHTFSVSGLWDTSSYHLTALNQDTKGESLHYCSYVLQYNESTVGADASVDTPKLYCHEATVLVRV